ncbi:MAG: hypothetical protein QOI68_4488 [Pseudonocardiales bacterium]|jgi:hypothetical protein|nr:hypothetical protein [Pseudonocardiales bacterium]MDT7608636.1 hypothetical protein [Pseudonocardiales bacterium]MDT7620813.1 hypothetical protein [Pseudonocardiales bacterium]MDT7694619.1 hypothetical protein [Pseudonocardiales bacterium]
MGDMGVNGEQLEVGPDGQGHFRVAVASLPEFKAIVARLSPRAVLYEKGKPHQLRLTDPNPAPPATFPAMVAFAVRETPMPAGSPRELMILSSPSVEGPAPRIGVVEHTPPAAVGAPGYLVVLCDSQDEYQAITERLAASEGGILMSQNGGVWALRHRSDDGTANGPFPQTVRFEVTGLPPG